MKLSVIVPTHNPDPGRLRRTLLALRAQTLPASEWETILVDNASTRFPGHSFFADCAPSQFIIVPEPALGLTPARRRGFRAAGADLAVLADDDNVLAPDYLAETAALFGAHPRIGALGGKSIPEFASPPPPWVHEFFPLLALRDPGENSQVSSGLRSPGGTRNEYPACAPLGAGMGLRRAAWTAWLEERPDRATPSDRRGDSLASGGDNDIVLTVMGAGWEVGYFPSLSLIHLIPATRLEPAYLARLNRAIQQSWMQVLSLHDANPWPALTRSSAAIRRVRAWWVRRAWSSPAARIRWHGDCGHFAGRVSR